VDAQIVPGARGAFDVTVDGQKIFSKHVSHRFPEPGEIIAELRKRQG
jgi:selT/selW/selH-like putative selenoprotein